MTAFKPSAPFTVAMELLIPSYSKEYGVETKSFPAEGIRINGNFKSYGGTERDVNGVYSIEDTAVVETFFRPDIKSDCRVRVLQNNNEYEIFSEPENIELRNQWMKFKVRRVKGGA